MFSPCEAPGIFCGIQNFTWIHHRGEQIRHQLHQTVVPRNDHFWPYFKTPCSLASWVIYKKITLAATFKFDRALWCLYKNQNVKCDLMAAPTKRSEVTLPLYQMSEQYGWDIFGSIKSISNKLIIFDSRVVCLERSVYRAKIKTYAKKEFIKNTTF